MQTNQPEWMKQSMSLIRMMSASQPVSQAERITLWTQLIYWFNISHILSIKFTVRHSVLLISLNQPKGNKGNTLTHSLLKDFQIEWNGMESTQSPMQFSIDHTHRHRQTHERDEPIQFNLIKQFQIKLLRFFVVFFFLFNLLECIFVCLLACPIARSSLSKQENVFVCVNSKQVE